MRYFPALIILLVFISVSSAAARGLNLDSLKRIVNSSIADTNKVNALNDLAWEMMYSDQDSSIDLSTRALTLAKKLGDPMGEGKAYHSLGWFHTMKNDYRKAMENYASALAIWQKLVSEARSSPSYVLLKQASTYGNIGFIYVEQGDHAKGLEYYFKALRTFEKLNAQQKIGTAYGNIGQVYDEQGDHKLAIEFYTKALKVAQALDDQRSAGRHLGNLGVAHFRISEKISDPAEKKKYLDDALDYYSRSEAIAAATGVLSERARVLHNTAAAYYSKSFCTGDPAERLLLKNKAISYFETSIQGSTEIEDTEMIAGTFVSLGRLYLTEKDLKKAADCATRSLELSSTTGLKSDLRDSYKLLAELDSMNGDMASAYRNLRLFYLYKDSINNEETAKQIVRDQMQFDFDKKEAEAKAIQDKKDAEHEKEKALQRIIIFMAIAGLLLAAVIAVIIFRSYRQKKKAHFIITRQKEEVEMAKKLIEERNKDITDSINYAQRIQKALLASESMLTANLGQWFICYKPKDIVSGDFYWAQKLSDGKFAMVTADSTGHGVPGSIMSMLNIACLNEAVSMRGLTSPKDILNYTRERIIQYLSGDEGEAGGKDGMDCSLLCFDLPNYELRYANANNKCWIVRNGEVIDLDADKMPVAFQGKELRSFSEYSVKLEAGDMVYTATDGFQDQFGGKQGKKYMQKRFRELLLRASAFGVSEQKMFIEQELAEWKEGMEQVDDICVAGIKIA